METLSCRAMRLALNNTVVFVQQASLSRAARLFGVALALLVLVSGCRRGKKTKSEAARPAATAELASVRPPPPPAESLPPPAGVPAPPRRGGTLRVHLDGEPPNLMPLGDVEASALQVTSGLVYETLLDCSDGSYKPGLAESWDVSDDRMRLAVRVRSGVRWHDHRAFGVLDVQASIEPLLRKGNDAAALRAALADVASLELATERTVRFVLKRPSDLALRALCDVPILPDHVIRSIPRLESAPIARAPIGTGPYKFVAWERGKRIRLERAPDYWGAAPGVDEIVFDVDGDAVRALNRTRRGEIDVLSRVLDVHYPDQVEPTTLHGAATLVRLASRRYSFLIANHAHAPLADARFRRAVAMLWDRKRFSSELHDELARPIGGPPLANAGPSKGPAPPATGSPEQSSGSPTRDDDIPAPAFDRARAIALLEEAGFRDNDADGVRDQGGRAIRLTMLEPAGNKLFNVEARAFVLEMRKAGILVDLVPTDAATIMQRLKRGEFDLAPMIWQGAPDDVPASLFGSDGTFNYGAYRSSALDAMLDEARAAAGPEARAPILTRIAQLLSDDQPAIFLYRYEVPALVAGRVRGLAAVGDRFDLRRVWLE
jgi:peptide/nickel transport system substrate-binding protein